MSSSPAGRPAANRSDGLDHELMDELHWSPVLFRKTLREVQADRFSNAANERATERAWRAVERRYRDACRMGLWLLFCEALRLKLGHA
jgi:hypothetical protein